MRRCRVAGIAWPLPEALDESALIAQLYRRATPARQAAAPDFAQVHRELARRSVTRDLLWREYPAPDGCTVHLQTTLGQQLFDIAQREGVPQIPTDSAQNEFGLRLAPF